MADNKNLMYKTTFLTLFFCLQISAQNNISSSTPLKLLLNLQFTKAQQEINNISHPKEKAYYEHYKIFLSKMILNDQVNNYKYQFEGISDSLLSNHHPLEKQLTYLSEIYLQKGIIEYTNGNQWSALRAFLKAYDYWQKSELEYPGLYINLKLKGIFNILLGNLPDPYLKWAGWFGYEGNSNVGFSSLNQYLNLQQNNPGYYEEALLYLGFSYLKFPQSDTTLSQFINNHSQRINSPLIKSTLVRCSFKIRNVNLCKNWLEDSIKSEYPPLQYLKGKYATLFLKEETPAIFDYFLTNKEGFDFKADANKYLSWHYLLKGDTINYFIYQNKIEQLQLYPTWEDKQAKSENKLKNTPDIYLLKARLLFDRGDYLLAKDVLINNKLFLSRKKNLKVEYYYRLGRCYQLLNDSISAQNNYKLALSNASENKRYFGPYAAIFLSELMIEQHKKDKAKFYIEEAQRLNNGELKNSIHIKIQLLDRHIQKMK